MTNDLGAVRIRAAQPADAASVAAVHMASRSATMPYLPPQRRTHEEVTRWIGEVLTAECRVWVAVRGDEVVGYAALAGDLLECLYLRPDLLRRGVGTLLLEEVARHSPTGLRLHVFAQNDGARAFYRRHGFVVVDTDDGSGNMENLPELTLRRRPGVVRAVSGG
ncbi:GNAT family N-acetyltransferase [Embleya sp. NPDC005971]|uniref:GNAT family N-acetyltransferase n=1 Tax=Embleya sp. NPDC005971 TaxID=3156724 RepID=UPI0033E38AC0